MQNLLESFLNLLNANAEAFDLEVFEMVLRAVVVYLFAVLAVRLGHKRFMGQTTAFDLILGIILGSVVSRAITGQSPFVATLCAAVALIVCHWMFAFLTFHFELLGPWIKGKPRLLVRDGKIDTRNMRKSLIGQRDLDEALRLRGQSSAINRVLLAHLERSGVISIILKEREPKVIEVRVEDGVQTVRVKVE